MAGLLLLAYVAFIALGMPDGLLGVAWPSIRGDFSIPLDAVGMLLPLSTLGYLTSSFLSGPLMSRWGVGKVLTVSCVFTAVALIGYTLVPYWWMMVSLGLLSGLGAGAIDAGLNSYVAANFGEGLMQWLHACYGIGVTLGPGIMTLTLSTLNSWRAGYRVVGGFQLMMAICFAATIPIWSRKASTSADNQSKRITEYKTPMIETMRQPKAWLSALLFFVYVGAEVSLGTWTYSLLVESRGIAPELAGLVTGSFWAMFTVGRLIAGLYAKRAGVDLIVQCAVIASIVGAVLLLLNPSEIVSLLAVALIGFSIAPVFAALTSGTSKRVSVQHAANTIGMQMAFSGLGGATIPGLIGILARRYSLELIPVCLIIVFAVLFGLYRLSMLHQKATTVWNSQEDLIT